MWAELDSLQRLRATLEKLWFGFESDEVTAAIRVSAEQASWGDFSRAHAQLREVGRVIIVQGRR